MIDEILNGTIMEDVDASTQLSDIEAEWVKNLQRKMDTEILTVIHTSDFIEVFKHHNEKTDSSPSSRHMGHYKFITEMVEQRETLVAEIIIMIINIAILTSRPLKRWQ